MSETDTRSVAEIMGWTEGHRVDSQGDCTLCGEPFEGVVATWCPNGIGNPTVDDMLAWLKARRFDVEIVAAFLGEDTHVELSAFSPLSLGRTGTWNGSAPTLHAALEAAVRAVAEVER